MAFTANKSSIALLCKYINFLKGNTNYVYTSIRLHFSGTTKIHIHLFVCYMTPINAYVMKVTSLNKSFGW